MERLGYKLLGSLVWFNSQKKIYVLTPIQTLKIDFEVNIEKLIGPHKVQEKHKKNKETYKIIHYKDENGSRRSIAEHILVSSAFIGRELFKNEIVHHVNGNGYDNSINNLMIMERQLHQKCHCSLQLAVAELYKQGKIGFTEGRYFLCEELQ